MMPEVKDLTEGEYELFRKLVYEKSGINLGDNKMQLVRARLGKLIRQGEFQSYREYYDHIERDPSGEKLCQLLDAISTNTTHLFREERHFKLLHKLVQTWAEDRNRRRTSSTLRIWSAGCSSGEEPHSIAMTVHDALTNYPAVEAKLLATDISTRMLSRAKPGLYDPHRVGTVPQEYQRRYFVMVRQDGQPFLQLAPELRRIITFARFNLMSPTFPFKHTFDVIFCRNVMIYFDRPTQEELVGKFAAHLGEGGHLMIGHSESLSNLNHPLSYVEPTVYRKS